MRRLHKVALAAVTLEALGAAWSFALLPRLRRWGATRDEASRPLPGDDLIPEPLYATTHAVSVRAPAEAVFPWLVQMGQDRGGFYTYDWLENLFRLGIHSADRIHPDWQDLRPGTDCVSLDPEGTLRLTVMTLDRPHAFVVRTGAPGEAPAPAGDFFKGEIAASWAFIVEPLDAGSCRLLVRWRASWRETVPAAFARAFLLEPAHFVMERGMLCGVRRRAELAVRGA